MPKPNKRSILNALTRPVLIEIGQGYEIPVRTNDNHAALVDKIARSRRAKIDAIVHGLSRDDLKRICRKHGLDDSGRKKRPIAERILGVDAAPELPGVVNTDDSQSSSPTIESVLRELPVETLKQLSRQFKLSLPRGRARHETICARLVGQVESLASVLGALSREDLRAVARAHSLRDDLRAIDDLVAEILGAAASPRGPVSAPSGAPVPATPAAPVTTAARETPREAARPAPGSERTSAALREPGALPRAGDLAVVRHRRYWVERVRRSKDPKGQTRVDLVCLDDDAPGRRMTVLWELELGARVQDPRAGGLGEVSRFDPPQEFAAYLNAMRWNCVTSTDPNLFQAPFRAGIIVQEHQLAPLQKALELPRANLFIADDVGLGKTIEAGLVLQELLLRQRVDYVLIVAPAAITLQWRGEMARRFGLNFEIVDRAFVSSRRQARGMDINPWSTHNRFIISYQTLRRPEYREPLLRFLGDKRKRKSLLVLDEAHTVAPSADKRSWGDSQLTKDARKLAPLFENRLFLSATPHNGHSGSFSALLEILDRQRFTRGAPVGGLEALKPVMIRRLKRDLKEVHRGDFPDRKIVELQLDHDGANWRQTIAETGDVTTLGGGSAAEVELSRLLAEYTEQAEPAEGDGRFAFITLQKRLLSSIAAFRKTLRKHANRVLPDEDDEETNEDEELYEDDYYEEDETYGVDSDDDIDEQVARVSLDLPPPDAGPMETLRAMLRIADERADEPSPKVLALLRWIRENQCPAAGDPACRDTAWKNRRVLIFTEYADTKRYLVTALREAIDHTDKADGRIMQFHGGMSDAQREELQEAFNEADGAHPVRILVATDAAREGINLQGNCADLFHFDIPWNPARMEQRNGRIDRVLQPSPEVRCHYFTYPERAEDLVLRTVVKKVDRITRELGSLSGVVYEQVEQALARGIRKHTGEAVGAISETPPDEQRAAAQADAPRPTIEALKREIASCKRTLDKSEEYLGFAPRKLREVVDVALRFVAGEGLRDKGGGQYELPPLPPSWVATTDHLRKPRRRDEPLWKWREEPLPAVSFNPEKTIGSDRVHLHLAHPVVHRLLSRFLAQGYAAHDLSRVTALRSKRHRQARVIALGRLSLFGDGATRLHDRIVQVAAPWNLDHAGDHLQPYASGGGDERDAQRDLEDALLEPSAVSERASKPMLESAESDFRALWPRVEDEAKAEEKRARNELEKRGVAESEALTKILQGHRKTLLKELAAKEQRLETIERKNKAEHRQMKAYYNHMADRLKTIDHDIAYEPQELAKSYDVVTSRLEPLGLVYLIRE